MSKIVSREVGLEVASLAATKKKRGKKNPYEKTKKNQSKSEMEKIKKAQWWTLTQL